MSDFRSNPVDVMHEHGLPRTEETERMRAYAEQEVFVMNAADDWSGCASGIDINGRRGREVLITWIDLGASRIEEIVPDPGKPGRLRLNRRRTDLLKIERSVSSYRVRWKPGHGPADQGDCPRGCGEFFQL